MSDEEFAVTSEEYETINLIYRYCAGAALAVVEEYGCWYPNFTTKHTNMQQHTAMVVR